MTAPTTPSSEGRDTMTWNFDINAAPRGQTITSTRKVGKNTNEITDFVPDHVWLATKCGKVIHSRWIPQSGKTPGRWSGLATTGEQPLAWQPYIVPEYPVIEPYSMQAFLMGASVA